MKTKRVRIAVAMRENGAWSAYGWETWDGVKPSDTEAAGWAQEGVDAECPVHFIEADVPVPEAKTIEGEVVK